MPQARRDDVKAALRRLACLGQRLLFSFPGYPTDYYPIRRFPSRFLEYRRVATFSSLVMVSS